MKINWTPHEPGTCIRASDLKPGISIFKKADGTGYLTYLCLRKRLPSYVAEAIALVSWGTNNWDFEYFAGSRQVILLGEIESFNATRV